MRQIGKPLFLGLFLSASAICAQPDLSWKNITPSTKQSLIKLAPNLLSDFSVDTSSDGVCLKGNFDRICGIDISPDKDWTPIAGTPLAFDELRLAWIRASHKDSMEPVSRDLKLVELLLKNRNSGRVYYLPVNLPMDKGLCRRKKDWGPSGIEHAVQFMSFTDGVTIIEVNQNRECFPY